MRTRPVGRFFSRETASEPVGGSPSSIAQAKDVATAWHEANVALDNWLGYGMPNSPQLKLNPMPDLSTGRKLKLNPLPNLLTPSAPRSPVAAAVQHGSGPTVRRGDAAGSIKKLQQRLKALGFDPGPIDGIFGPKTEAAVKRFQKKHGLSVDGVVGHDTWDKLGVRVKAASAPAVKGGVVNTPDGQMVHRDGHLISVNIADQFDKMVAAARADGVSLEIESAYRSYAEQVVLWNLYGHNPARVARPGTSNHQKGEAIDYKSTPGAWAWLKQNATRFGFHNYPPEPWHYSLTGN